MLGRPSECKQFLLQLLPLGRRLLAFSSYKFQHCCCGCFWSSVLLLYVLLVSSSYSRHVHIKTENSTFLLMLSATLTLFLNCTIFSAVGQKATGRLMLRDEPRFICFCTLLFLLEVSSLFTAPREAAAITVGPLPLRKGVSLRSSINQRARLQRPAFPHRIGCGQFD